MEIRCARAADAEGISALVRELSCHFLVAPPGSAAAAAFSARTSVESFRALIVAANRVYRVAHDGDTVAGFISLRDASQVSQLFVAPRHQRRGLARRLWASALDAAGAGGGASPPRITVYASPNAVVVCERFGFEATGCRTETAGVVFVPMAFMPSSPDAIPPG